MWAGKAHSQSMDAVNALVPYAFWALIRRLSFGARLPYWFGDLNRPRRIDFCGLEHAYSPKGAADGRFEG